MESDYPSEAINDINTRVDAIRSSIRCGAANRREITCRHQMSCVQVLGLKEREMKELGETLRDELVRQPWVSIVELQTARPRSID